MVQKSAPASGQADGPAAWRDRVCAAFCETSIEVAMLGTRHACVQREGGTVLLVTFDTWPSAAPAGGDGFALAQTEGWSHMAILADGATWWRDPAVHAHFDRLIDDGFFEDFDKVVFFGIGMGGYAATSFCVAAPGCTVLAIRPQATLEAAITEWDRRFPEARRLQFNDRYGFAPDMVEAAGTVLLVYDPAVPEDAMHAALFTRPHVRRLRCRGAGSRPESGLVQTGLMAELLRLAAQGLLTTSAAFRLHRAARRRDSAHLLRMLARLTLRGRRKMARCVAQAALGIERAP